MPASRITLISSAKKELKCPKVWSATFRKPTLSAKRRRDSSLTYSLNSGSPIKYSRASHPRDAAVAISARLGGLDRKSTRLNSSHTVISYAVFCLKKKKKKKKNKNKHKK